MDTNGEQLHPNWRALATVHIELKRFVREGTNALESGHVDCNNKKYEIQCLTNGNEVKTFYDEMLKDDVVPKNVVDRNKAVKDHQLKHCHKVPFDKTKYFRYAAFNNVEELRKFQYRGANVNVCDNYGWTALMMAACDGALDAVNFLLELGVNKDAKDNCGNTAIDLAKKNGQIAAINLMQRENMFNKNENKEMVEVSRNTMELFFCALCNKEFTETTQRDHLTSTIHQFNQKSNLPENKLKKFNIPQKNRGLQLMVKQGWDKESGLGPTQNGRLYPVKTVIRKQRTGIGIDQPPARVTHFEAFDLRATQRHASDYYRKKPRNRNDIRREKQREWKRERRLRNELS